MSDAEHSPESLARGIKSTEVSHGLIIDHENSHRQTLM